jgi:molybdate transport system substrate-binding protein
MRSVLTAVLAALLLPTPAAKADDLVILSAAAVRPALLQLPAMVAKTSGHRVTVSFGNATAISGKITAGDRVDIAILPPRQLTDLIKRGTLSADGRANLGVVKLGVAVRAGSAAMQTDTADAFKQAMIAATSFGMPDPADGSTSSRHMVNVLARLGIADAMRGKTRYFKDGTQALHALAKGEIALTVAPMTSIRVVPGVALAGPLPDDLQSTTVYAAALSSASAASGAAKSLLATLTSPAFATVLRDKGIDAP